MSGLRHPCPFRLRWELEQWASKYFRKPEREFKRYKKNQLYAMWYKAQEKSLRKKEN